jgi:hypothetical protein
MRTGLKKSAARLQPAQWYSASYCYRGTDMPTKKSSHRKYSPKASKSVEREMKALKKGKLKSGSGRKVTSRKQAIAIGLSEARKSGARVPKKSSS